MAAPERHYHYSVDYQQRILATAVQDVGFLAACSAVLSPEYFESPWHQTVARAVLRLAEANGLRAPQQPEVLAEIDDVARAHSMSADEREALRSVVGAIYQPLEIDLSLRERVIDFGARRVLRRAVLDVGSALDHEPDLDKIRMLLRTAIQAGSDCQMGLDAGEGDFVTLLRESNYDAGHRWSTGLPSLDRAMWGGLGKGELTVVCGDPGRGKSTFCVNLAAGAVMAAARVAYITLELGELDVWLKFVARLTGRTINQIVEGLLTGTTDAEALLGLTPLRPGALTIRYFAPGTLSADGVTAYLTQLASVRSIHPNVLVIDYADRMHYNREDSYQGLGLLYDQLIALGQERQMAVVTASQARREEYRTGRTSLTGLSHSWLKAANADNVIILNQNEEDRERGLLTLHLGKIRRGQDGINVDCMVHYDKATIKERHLPVGRPPLGTDARRPPPTVGPYR